MSPRELSPSAVLLIAVLLTPAEPSPRPAGSDGQPVRWPKQGALFPSRPPLVVPTPFTRPTSASQTTPPPATDPSPQQSPSSTTFIPSTPSSAGTPPAASPPLEAGSPPVSASSPETPAPDSMTTTTTAAAASSTWFPSVAVSNDAPVATSAYPTVPTTPAVSSSLGFAPPSVWGLFSVPSSNRNKMGLHKTYGTGMVQQVVLAPLKWTHVVPQQVAWISATTPPPSTPAPAAAQSILLVPVQHQTLVQRLQQNRQKDTAYLVELPWTPSDSGSLHQQQQQQPQHQYGLLSVAAPSKPAAALLHPLRPAAAKQSGYRHRDSELLLPRTGADDGDLEAPCHWPSHPTLRHYIENYNF